MIFWRGYGALGILIPLLVSGIFAAIGGSLNMSPGQMSSMAGLGMVVGGGLAWLAGQQLNVTGPDRKIAEQMAAREQYYQQEVARGSFSRGPEFPPARSREEAQQQVREQLDLDHAAFKRRLRNQHTVYVVPFQWAGVALAVVGLILIVTGFLT